MIQKGRQRKIDTRNHSISERCQFKEYIQNNCMNNTPIMTVVINRARGIYGPSESMLKGKDTRHKSNSHQCTLQIPVSPKTLSEYRDLKLSIDIIYVCGLLFLIIKYGSIDLHSVQYLKFRSLNIIAQGQK